MRKLLTLAMVLLIPFCGFAQKKGFKLVENNPSPKPKWVTENERIGYLYVKNQEAATLADAKAAAMTVIIDEMSRSVAVNIESEIMEKAMITNANDKQAFEEEIINKTVTRVAKMPAIQGVSIQRADVYYERYYRKKTGEEYYLVTLRYPFSEFDRKDLIEAYNAQEKAINDNIKKYTEEVETVNSIEDIKKNITYLQGIKNELETTDTRIHKINSLLNLYNEIYKSIMIEVVENEPGHMALRLVYKGRTIYTSQKPSVSSDCAQDFNISYDDGVCNIAFDSEYCYEQDDPVIKVMFRAGNNRPSKQIRIKFR